MMGYDDQGPIIQEQAHVSTNDLLTKVFFRMFLGLLTTALVAAYTYYSGLLINIVESGGFFGIIIAELVVAFAFSLGFRKFSAGTVSVLFFIYSALTGVTFSSIFVVFELESIAYAFLGTAAVFGVMAYIGKTTKRDLTNMGTILMVSLFVAIIVSVINLFVGNSMLDIILDWVIIAIFMGFTVYDMNKIIRLQDEGFTDDAHLYVYGAMELYLDFINLFIRILQIFGRVRRD
ncbi:MAG: Bax inhibitor-1/YccA family protein [Clostridia bacterium]|nr:Bax inhibitor-1/YccA family protein [Clostridia bacterium]